ncbi:N-acetylmuramoyl-L-alanine amidase [Phycobium rhodophyticola]
MSRLARVLIVFVLSFCGAGLAAQGFSGLARVDGAASGVADLRGGAQLEIGLTQGIPYRLYTLPKPDRLVIDFREVDWTGFEADSFDQAEKIKAVRVGAVRPGWSRMVVDLVQPMLVNLVEMQVDPDTGGAHLSINLRDATREAFNAAPLPTDLMAWGQSGKAAPKQGRSDRLTVLIDPGHGGIDPGAERHGHTEKHLMLMFAFDLRDALLRVDGVDVVLTRVDDRFVSLEQRVAIAHQVGADVLVSLHADALSEGRARGAVVYTLSKEASDQASALMAERHERGDLLAGVDLTGADDVVADVLLDLARAETQPRTDALAREFVTSLKKAGVPLNRRPNRSAAFSVLKAADIPSILLEIGFLSSDRAWLIWPIRCGAEKRRRRCGMGCRRGSSRMKRRVPLFANERRHEEGRKQPIYHADVF